MMAGSSHLIYVMRDAVRSLRENSTTTVLTAVTLGFALAIFSMFLIVFINLDGIIDRWGERTHVIAYVKDSAATASGEGLVAAARKIPGVKSAAYTSKKEAFEELKKELSGHESVLDGVDPGALPASVEVTVDEAVMEAGGTGGLEAVVAALKGLDWAAEVTYSREWVEKFSAFVGFLKASTLLVGAFLAAATLFIISNTIRLTVYARKDEIEIMRLVGASDRFIKFPFFIEGMVQGFLGGVLALGVVAGATTVLGSRIPPYFEFALELPVSAPALLVLLVAAGITLGVAGCFISMARFLRV